MTATLIAVCVGLAAAGALGTARETGKAARYRTVKALCSQEISPYKGHVDLTETDLRRDTDVSVDD